MLYHVSEFHSFLRLNNIPLYVYMTFVYSSVDGHLDCFYLLAIVNNTAVKIDVQVSV